jgi:DivIVA domain-containing protein
VDPHSVKRIRNATFSLAVRGYDRHEVDRFLGDLADWLDDSGGDETSEHVRAELERIGEQTAEILTAAHDAAEAMRADADREVRQKLVDANLKSESLRADADGYAEDAREDADAYARKTRGDADAYARGVRQEADSAKKDARGDAEREAKRIVDEANRRRREIETVISDLEERRDAVLNELEKLASGLAGTATEHRGAAQPAADAEAADGAAARSSEAPQKSK